MKTINMKFLSIAALTVAMVAFSGCDDDESTPQVNETLNSEILVSFSDNVVRASYDDLKAKASTLNDNVIAFAATPSAEKLITIQNNWKAARAAWEQTESFLFGPVDSDAVDPSIDSWPIGEIDMLSIIASDDEFTEEYMENLDFEVKGFHPIEFIIFGSDGEKTFGDFTDAREVEYLKALSLNLKTLTANVADAWNPSEGNYKGVFLAQSQRDAFEAVVSAMAIIAGEVGEAKIGEVYAAQDPTLEESPYSKNSLTDFTYNIKGIENVYLGKYTTDGKGLEDLVKQHNLTLDTEIKAAISSAVAALNNIDGTFGEAVEETNIKVQNAIDAISALQEKLDDGSASNNDLFYFVQQHTN